MKRILTCLLVFAFVTISNCKQFRCDYKYFNKADGWMDFSLIFSKRVEYTNPQRGGRNPPCHCGSKLASPLNHNLASAMLSVVTEASIKCGLYTGIHAFFSKGDFHSIEGIPLSKIPHTWVEGEPDNDNNNESCLLMLSTGELADVNCSEPLPYLCYRKSRRAVLNSCGTVDNEYTFESRTGSCYKFHKVPRTWSRAYMACTAEGGHLAIINSDTEAQVIKELFGKNPAGSMRGNFWKDVAFVGFHDWGEHGEFLTIEGQTLEEAGYAKFSGGEPNNATTGEYCGAVYRSALLDDLWCENKYAFICEMSPDSLLCEDSNEDSQ